MSRKKLSDRNVRKLFLTGGGKSKSRSYSVTIPIEIIRKLNWKKSQKVVLNLNKKNKKITTKDWEK